jgi:hypothetical protein
VIDQRERFERAFELFDMPEPAMARLVARRHRKERNRRVGTTVVALAVAAAAIGGVARAFLAGPGTRPAKQPTSPFVGTWISTELDGSSRTMVIQASGDETVEVLVRDDAAPMCGGTPSTMIGTGRLHGGRELVIPSPVLTCDDGSTPQPLGPPLEEQLRDYTLVLDPAAGELSSPGQSCALVCDSYDAIWTRPGERVDTAPDRFPPLDPEKTVNPEQMAVIRQLVEATNTGDVDGYIDLFASRGAFNPGGNFAESSSLFGNSLPVADAPLVEAWMAINDAWGLEVDIIACARVSETEFGERYGRFIDRTDTFVHCDVATRWHALSLEVTERWTFELEGTTLFAWRFWLLDINPPARDLPLDYDGLLAWEAWLKATHPDDAARYLNARPDFPDDCDGCSEWEASQAPGDPERAAMLASLLSPAERDWMIDGHRFSPDGLIPYDPASADEIEASIQEYLDSR